MNKTSKKTKNRKIFIIAGFVIIALVVIGFFLLKSQSNESEKVNRIYNTSIVGDEVYRYESSRSFNGDGYTLIVQELTSEIKSMLTDGQLSQFPTIEQSLQDYEASLTWTQTPVDPKYNEAVAFALDNGYINDSEAGTLADYSKTIETVINEEGNYYAFIASNKIIEMGGRPLNIDMYVVDTQSNLIYFINQDT